MKEKRFRSVSELRADSQSRTISGYALKFNELSNELSNREGTFYETILPGSLDGVIEKSDIFAVLNHDQSRGVLARSKYGQGTLKLTVDEVGLRYEFEVPDTELGREVIIGIERGDIAGSSFCFTVAEDRYYRDDNDAIVREIVRFEQLFDVSPVYVPAYDSADVDVRGFTDFLNNEEKSGITTDMKKDKNFEKFLRSLLAEYEKRSEDEEQKEENSCETDEEENREDDVVEEEEKKEEETETDENREDEEEKEEEVNSEEEVEEEKTETEEETETESVDEEEKEEEKEDNKRNITKKSMKKNNFSLLKAVNDLVEGRSFDAATQELNEAGKAEFRKANISTSGRSLSIPVNVNNTEKRGAILAGTAGAGQEVVAEDKLGLVVALRERLVANAAGATILTGCKSDISIPYYSGTKSGWKQEGASADRGEGEFTEKFLRPKRLCSVIHISRQFLLQDTISAEEALRRDIVESIAVQFEKTMFGTGAGTAFEPAGLFNGVSPETNPFTFEDSVLYESELESANHYGSYTYVLSPAAKAICRSTSLDSAKSSGRFVMENNEINGYPVISSGVVTEKGLLVGDFSELYIAQFGGIEILYDNMTLADQDVIRLVVNTYIDYCVRRDDAIVKKILA